MIGTNRKSEDRWIPVCEPPVLTMSTRSSFFEFRNGGIYRKPWNPHGHHDVFNACQGHAKPQLKRHDVEKLIGTVVTVSVQAILSNRSEDMIRDIHHTPTEVLSAEMLEELVMYRFRALFCFLRHTELYAIGLIRRPVKVFSMQRCIIYLLSALLCYACYGAMIRSSISS